MSRSAADLMFYRCLLRLSLPYYDAKGTTDSTSCTECDPPAIQWILVEGIIASVTSDFWTFSRDDPPRCRRFRRSERLWPRWVGALLGVVDRAEAA